MKYKEHIHFRNTSPVDLSAMQFQNVAICKMRTSRQKSDVVSERNRWNHMIENTKSDDKAYIPLERCFFCDQDATYQLSEIED